jgi:hypothetical protein
MDDLENPNAEAPAAADAPPDPVQAAEADAWLAQFRADNAAAVSTHNFEAAGEAMAEAKAASAEKAFDMDLVDYGTKTAADLRAEAGALEAKEQADAGRRDEYEAKRQVDLHMAETTEATAAKFRSAATEADQRSVALTKEAGEIQDIYRQHQDEYDIIQEQAVAAQRIATDEAKLPHPGDPAPADPADHHQP